MMAVFVIINWFGVRCSPSERRTDRCQVRCAGTDRHPAVCLRLPRQHFSAQAGSRRPGSRPGCPPSPPRASSTPTPASRGRSTCPARPGIRAGTFPGRLCSAWSAPCSSTSHCNPCSSGSCPRTNSATDGAGSTSLAVRAARGQLNVTWLSWLLYADAIVSPSGSALTFTATSARESYAMGRTGSCRPRWRGPRRWGVPHRALLINFVIGLAFLLPFELALDRRGDQRTGPVRLLDHRGRAGGVPPVAPSRGAGWIRGMWLLAPVARHRDAHPVLGDVARAPDRAAGAADRRARVRRPAGPGRGGLARRAGGLWIVGYLLAILLVPGSAASAAPA